MDIFLQILFWFSVCLIFHSYVIFPIILYFSAKSKTENTEIFKNDNNLPGISVIMASYNEEKNIEKKIITTLNTDYPYNKTEFLIGSDNSSDNTDYIIKKYAKIYPQIKFYPFAERTGKTGIINFLKNKAENDILIMTDTKVFFKKNTLYNLVKHLKNKNIDIVGGILKNSKRNRHDVSVPEDTYMKNEMIMKYREGLAGKCSMGVFGAVYAIKKEALSIIPSNFKVDDFFITMKVIEKERGVIFEKNAVADEEITGDFKEEFKRKVRIATGNFQNLFYFMHILKRPFRKASFYFFSHKVIRWAGPFLIASAVISNIMLLNYSLYKITFLFFILSVTFAVLDLILKNTGINIKLFRYFTHFYGMNIALAIGFFNYLKGVESGTWEPSKR